MKNRIVILLCFLLLCSPILVNAEEELTYEQAKEAVRQSMQAWYMRGSYRQYNSSKNTYGDLRHPEDSTSQDTGYSVCSGFTNDVWMEAFGFLCSNDKIVGGHTPGGSSQYCAEARKHLDEKGCTTSNPNKTGCKGEYLVYYYHAAEGSESEKKYFYNPKNLSTSEISSLSNFLNVLQPGDILSYDGHSVILYDFKYKNGKRVDALLLSSGSGGKYAKTKIDPTQSRLHQLYYYKEKKTETNNILDISSTYMSTEGTVRWIWLSNYDAFVKDGKIRCKNHMCSVTRAYHKGSDGKAVLNYDVTWKQQIKTSKARIEMPGIFIEKTSNKNDKDSVTLGKEITYTVSLINNSNIARNDGDNRSAKYTSIYVVETLPSEVEFVNSSIDGSLQGTYNSSNNTIKWKISSIPAGGKVDLKYKVKVKNNTKNLGHTIEVSGKVYKSSADYFIPTGVVSHEIINSTSVDDSKYKSCYNSSKKNGATSLKLIQKTYECVYGNNLEFDFNDFSTNGENMLDKLINRPISNPAPTKEGIIRLKTTGNNGKNKLYSEMILNDYWGGLVLSNYGTSDGSTHYILPKWRRYGEGSYVEAGNRAKTIVKKHFKTGDVLIYYIDKANTKSELQFTNENGLYAYMYIDGNFVGVNHSGKSARNEFTTKYYTDNKLDLVKKLYEGKEKYYDYVQLQTIMGKDSYVILRPEKVITEVTKITVKTNPSKTTYFKKESLDLSGGVIKVTNNDGTTEEVSMTDPDVKVKGYNSKTVGEQELKVTYKGKSTTFTVTVNENQITSISVKKNPTKTTYFVGDDLDLSGGTIKLHYADGSTKSVSMKNSNVTVSGYNKNSTGNQTITVKYSNKTTTFTVTVNSVSLSTIVISQYPNKLSYTVGEDLSLAGGKITLKYNNGTSQAINMSDSSINVSGYNKNVSGNQTITLSTQGKIVTFEVVVNAAASPSEVVTLDSISVYSLPEKTNYIIGEALDLSRGKIKLKYYRTAGTAVSTSYEIIDMNRNDVSVTGFSSSTEGTKTLTVTYSNKSTTFNVEVSKKDPKLVRIEVTKMPKKRRYVQYQEDLNPSEGSLTLIYSDNTTSVIDLIDDSVDILDFDNTVLGEQQIKVVYGGLETSFPVTVYDIEDESDDTDDENGPITKVEAIQGLSKVDYIQGVETFDVSGIILRITYEDGEFRNIELSEYPGLYTISGFDNTKLGEQTVIVNYKGFELPFTVNIKREDEMYGVPDTFMSKSTFATLFGLLLLTLGTCIIYKNIKKEEA